MQLDGKRVLVTGADGFIGSHLAERLVGRCGHLRAMVLYNSFDGRGWLDQLSPDRRAAIEVLPGDVRDPDRVRQLVGGMDVVFHLAALIAVPYSYSAPASYLETNARGTLNLLEAARDAGVERFLHTSTSEVYGLAERFPIEEDHPVVAHSPYAASKIAADQLALSFHRSYDLAVTLVRPFNTYGPRQSARAVIPTMIVQLLSGDGILRLGETATRRDFSFVADIADGFAAVAEADALVGGVVHLASGEDHSIGEVADLLGAIVGRPARLTSDPARLRPPRSEVQRLLASNERARRLAGWTPAHAGRAGLERGLSETVGWFREPANLARYRAEAYVI